MRRRSNNEGCIYQRSDGRWVVQITLQGKLRQFYFKTNDAAVEHLKELHRQQVVGKNIAASDEPFGVYLARWLTETKSSKVRQNTLEDYVAVAQNHILPVLGQKPIGSIDTATIQSLYDGMSAAGKSPQVIRKTHVLLTGVFNSMLPDRIIERNPVGQTDRPKIVKKQKVLFDDEQERIFLETVLRSKSRYKDLALVYWKPVAASRKSSASNGPVSALILSTSKMRGSRSPAEWPTMTPRPPAAGAKFTCRPNVSP